VWWTDEGQRTLRGAEWELFREGLSSLWERVEQHFTYVDPDDDLLGVEAFDELQLGQKLAMLTVVALALSRPDIAAPPPTALGEATVAAVFACIFHDIVFEVETCTSHRAAGAIPAEQWLRSRRLVLAAYREAEEEVEDWLPPDDEGDPIPAPADAGWSDLEDWERIVQELAARVLWDHGDYQEGLYILDLPPDVRRRQLARLDIAEGYFSAIAPDLAESRMWEVRRAFGLLTGRRDPA
jgi:hypothetical protein